METVGKHFKIVKHPKRGRLNRTTNRFWSVYIDSGEYIGELLYTKDYVKGKYGIWDFGGGPVWFRCRSNFVEVPSIKALGRLITKKWQFPVGTTLKAVGHFFTEEYTIRITK